MTDAAPASHSTKHRPIAGWLSALGLAIALRVIWAILVPAQPVSDSLAYDAYAKNLVSLNQYCLSPGVPSAYWPVGTSFTYSILYRLFGHTYGPIVVFNIILGALTTLLILELATRWFGPKSGLLAGFLFAAWPSQIEFTTILASELLFNFLVLLAIYCWNRRPNPNWHDAIFTGIALAAASYVRPLALVLPAVFLLWTLAKGKWRATILHAAVTTGVMLLLILPWTLRNYLAFHQLVLVSTNGGANLWMGNSPGGTMEHIGYRELPPRPLGMNEAQFDQYLGKAAKQYIREHPDLFLRRSAKRIVNLFDRETIGIDWNEKGLHDSPLEPAAKLIKYTSTFYWWVMLLGGITGICVLLAKTPILKVIFHPAILMWAYFTAVHAVTVSNDRYHFPAIPFIAALIGLAIATLFTKRTHH